MESDELTPPEISAAAKSTRLNLLPEKSKDRYNYSYNKFMKWRNLKGIKDSFSEDVLLTYIDEISKSVKPTTLWTQYSMLRSTLYIHHNINIGTYLKLNAYLKRRNDDYSPKKTKVLTPEHINEFIVKAPDKDYLFIKVALVIGISGACRKQELQQLTVDDIQDLGTLAVVSLKNTKNITTRKFTISGIFYGIFKKYFNLRPEMNEKRFFLNYKKARCTKQLVGINKIGNVPKEVAKFLKLENPYLYTGHCFRRSILVDSGEDTTSLKKRMEISKKIVEEVAGPSTATQQETNLTLEETRSDDVANNVDLLDLTVEKNIQNTLLSHNVSQTPINFHNCYNNHFTFNFYGVQEKK